MTRFSLSKYMVKVYHIHACLYYIYPMIDNSVSSILTLFYYQLKQLFHFIFILLLFFYTHFVYLFALLPTLHLK